MPLPSFNGKTVEGRALTVNEARPREARPPGGGGGGGGGLRSRWRRRRRIWPRVVAAATAAVIGDRAKRPIQYFCSKKAPASTAGRFLLIPFRKATGMCWCYD
jgi:hypothetical protein